MVRLNRIYTKAGDGGDTRLVGGQKVRKHALRIEAYGTIDELSACLGLARTELVQPGAPDGAADRWPTCCCGSRTSSSTWEAIWRRCRRTTGRRSR